MKRWIYTSKRKSVDEYIQQQQLPVSSASLVIVTGKRAQLHVVNTGRQAMPLLLLNLSASHISSPVHLLQPDGQKLSISFQ
jgi:hypothetical protein